MPPSQAQTINAAPRGTRVTKVALCPEITLYLKPGGLTLEAFRREAEAAYGAGLPYWAIAWPGGQALARYLLDNPGRVRGARVLDLGTGSGLAAIAAARAGAGAVTAVDRDPHGIVAANLNACLNDVFIETRHIDLDRADLGAVDVVLAGDLWYERFDAARATRALRQFAGQGALVLAGDPGRAFFPHADITPLASYQVPSDADIEGASETRAGVWRIGPHAGTA